MSTAMTKNSLPAYNLELPIYGFGHLNELFLSVLVLSK